jgi:hypothetical protein
VAHSLARLRIRTQQHLDRSGIGISFGAEAGRSVLGALAGGPVLHDLGRDGSRSSNSPDASTGNLGFRVARDLG